MSSKNVFVCVCVCVCMCKMVDINAKTWNKVGVAA